VRRHPHVFGTGDAKTSEDVKKRWEEIKADEKKDRGETPQSILASVPRSLPALVEAFQISSKVAHIGFDWANTDQVLDKLHEELNELAEARQADSREELENEIGDILFALVNVARHLKVDPEQALRKSNAKFRRRFSHVEKNAQLPGATLEQMEALWQEAKAGEARGRE
jgi:MazG family protein